jgi:hypothetical protein
METMLRTNGKTLEDFFQASRVSFMDIGEKLPNNLIKIPVPENDSNYYTEPSRSLIIRESASWGLVGECFWLLAGDVPDSSKKRIGCANLADFEKFKASNGWIRLKNIYDSLPKEQLEIVNVWQEESGVIIEGSFYKCRRATSKHGPCNNPAGWAFYQGNKHVSLPPVINVTGEDISSLKIKGFNIPNILTREAIIFAVLLDEIVPDSLKYGDVQIFNQELKMLNEIRNFQQNDFSELLKRWGITFMFKNYYFMFSLNNEIIKIKIKESDQEEKIISCIKEIEFS